ncbi:MAG: NfeD family protein [Rickettsiales bacterium]
MSEHLLASYLWLIAGAIMLAIEAFGIPGIGFLFAGIGAFIAGLVITSGFIAEDAYISQFACWFLATTLSAILLWKKLRRLSAVAPDKQYNNIVGTTATVATGGLTAGIPGSVKWSGALMTAELETGYDAAAEGATVDVIATRGTTLIVKPR